MKILCLDGIGSHTTPTKSSGILDHVANPLAESLGCEAKWIPWPAAMSGVGGAGSWGDNSLKGVDELVREMRSHIEPVILLAYSGGNRVVHEFLDMYGEFHHRILAVGLMSDPWRPADRWQHGTVNPGIDNWGVCGQDRGPIPDRTFWTTARHDVISNAPSDSLLRHMADFSGGDPDTIVQDTLEVLRKNQLQLALFLGLPPWQWFLSLGRRIQEARFGVEGYLFRGDHTSGYTRPYDAGNGDLRSLAQRLADTISYRVRKNYNV